MLRGAREGRDPHFFFNTEYYLSQLSAPEKIENPLLHFLSQSKWECANPHPLFDCGYYRHRYLQGRREINPLVDFIRHGRAANRVPLSLFDADYYLGANPDVAAAGVDPLLHYILEGGRERRNPHPLFDTGYYLDTNADVAASGMNPLIHYVAYGARERRNPHPLFDAKYYLDQLPDAGTIENPLLHFLSAPNGEDADPHPLFDSAFYRRTYSQGRTDGINSLLHYVTQGARAGHAPNAVFDARGYAFEHPDVDVLWRQRPRALCSLREGTKVRRSSALRGRLVSDEISGRRRDGPRPLCALCAARIERGASWLTGARR